MPSKPAGSNKLTSGREEDSIKFLSAERKRLERENKEKKRQLEELKKQELLIENAAKKGGGYTYCLMHSVVTLISSTALTFSVQMLHLLYIFITARC